MYLYHHSVRFPDTIFLLLLAFTGWDTLAQNQNKADSLIQAYRSIYIAHDSLRYAALIDIVENSTKTREKLEYAQQALEVAKTIDDPLMISKAYTWISRVQNLRGELSPALDNLLKALDYCEKSDHVLGIASIHTNIGDLYSIQRNSQKAIAAYQKAIGLFRQEGEMLSLAATMMNLGDEYLRSEKLDSALYYLRESKIIFGGLNSPIGIAYTLGNTGIAYGKQGKYGKAEENLSQAISILTDLDDRYALAIFMNAMGGVFQEKGDYEKALDYTTKSFDTAMADGLKEQIRDASLKLSELYKATSDFEKALVFQEKYMVYRDSINDDETIRKLADLKTEYEVAKKQAQVDLLNVQKQRQRLVAVGLGLTLILVVALAYILLRNFRQKVRTNKLLEEQKAELEALNQTKDKFFSIISHDLRGPVNSFYGFSGLIKSYVESKDLEQLQELSGYMDQSVDQLSRLLDNLLKWAVHQQGDFPNNPQQLDFTAMLDDLFKTLDPMARAKQITFSKTVPADMYLWVDPNSTMTIFRNLIHNAIKFTPEGGSVKISVDFDNTIAEIRIADSGVGIPKDKLKTLFYPENKNNTWGTNGEKGLGLGLRLVREFTDMNKGEIEVDSNVGKGTVFMVKLPLFAPEVIQASTD